MGSGGKEYVFGRVDSGHHAARTLLGRPSPPQRTSVGKLGWLIIRLIGPRWSGVRWRL
ncbi:hypothetical protein BZL29_2032 [Mycobacterium kansasii]|uniref:Uncharacterized protein n=1 Tax=Mycobacterium kansasii TaxID=1768 RepID=A0A1V3XPC3_MYCKA|nr:hypothetical protein BZL29_2032 [Mycobacterium kansasii]